MSNNTTYNPWAGLSSYQDPETANVQLKFCGRDNESFDVAQLIDDNIFVTLYGKSGTGKTSLLNAGVFPRLRQEQYLPVSIRLGMEALDTSFQHCILSKLNQAIMGRGSLSTIDVVPMPADEQATECLWSYFARTRFIANDGSTLFPVIVFDQFEEVFRGRREEAETLLRQIHFMMDESHALSNRVVEGQPYRYDFNFRFVVSIREDDLYRLEDSIDNCYLPDMKRCRYRLRSLSEQGARDAILIPGAGLFRDSEKDVITEAIITKSRNVDGSISTNIISLLCSRIYADYQKSDADFISPALVDSFIKGNPFERFYNEATQGFSIREKNYIEEHLVDSTGRRNSIPESDFLLNVPKGAILLEGDSRILQRASTTSDGSNSRIELIHDSFCEPLSTQKEKRAQRRKWGIIVLTSLIAIAISAIAIWVINLYLKSKQQYVDILAQQERIYANKASQFIEDEDPFSALLLLNELTDEEGKFHEISLQVEAEFQMREAIRVYNSSYLEMVDVLRDKHSYKYSPKGNYLSTIVSDPFDLYIKILDANTYQEFRRFSFGMNNGLCYCISNDDRWLAVSSELNTLIYDIETGEKIKEISDNIKDASIIYSSIDNVIFSLDKKFLIFTNHELYDTHEDCSLMVFDINNDSIAYFDASNNNINNDYHWDGSSIIRMSEDGGKCMFISFFTKNTRIRIYDTKDWHPVFEQSTERNAFVCFYDDDNILVGTSNGLHKINIQTKYSILLSSSISFDYYSAAYAEYVMPDKKSILIMCGSSLYHINIENGEVLNAFRDYSRLHGDGLSVRDNILVTFKNSKVNYFYKIPTDSYSQRGKYSSYLTINDRLSFTMLPCGYYAIINTGKEGEYRRYTHNRALRIADANNQTLYYDDEYSYDNLMRQNETNTLYAIAKKDSVKTLVKVDIDKNEQIEKTLLDIDIDKIYSVSYSSSPTKILCKINGELCEWDCNNERLSRFGMKNIYKATYSPIDNNYIIIDSVGNLYQLINKTLSSPILTNVIEAKYTSDGKHILACSDEMLYLLNSNTSKVEKKIKLNFYYYDNLYDEIIVNKNWNFFVLYSSYHNDVYRLDLKELKLIERMTANVPYSSSGAISFSDDGTHFASCYYFPFDTTCDVIKPQIEKIYTQQEIIEQARQIVGRKPREGEIDELLK